MEVEFINLVFICFGVFLASLMDAIGGGGGIISLPTYLMAGLPIHTAIGTNKLSSCIGTSASTFKYIKSGFVDFKLAIPAGALAIIGAYIGTRLQLTIDEVILKYVLIIILPFVAYFVVKQKNFSEVDGNIPKCSKSIIVFLASFIIGMYDGFYGPGTGTFLLLVFVNIAKINVRTASGMVKFVNLSSNISSLITVLFFGKIYLFTGLVAAIFSVLGHYLGATLAIKSGSKIVRPVVLVVTCLLMVKVVFDLF